jgi:hypothetical protein
MEIKEREREKQGSILFIFDLEMQNPMLGFSRTYIIMH